MTTGKSFAKYALIALTAITAAAGWFLIMADLQTPTLWGDEAETALISLNTLKYGYPKSYDGERIVTIFEDRRESTPGFVWTWHPWAQFYACAGSMAVFGKNAKGARLPFALAAWLSALIVIWIISREPRAGIWSVSGAAYLFLNPAFIVYARQARYYGFVLAGTAAFAAAYLYWREKGGIKRAGAAAFCAAFLFHANYFAFGCAVLSAVLHAAVIDRRRTFKEISVIAGLTAALTLPWYLVFKPASGRLEAGQPGQWLEWFGDFFAQTNDYIIPFVLLLLVLAAGCALNPKRGGFWTAARGYFWINLAVVLLLASIVPIHSFRFLLPAYIFAALIIADFLVLLAERSAIAAIILFYLCAFTRIPANMLHPGALFDKSSLMPAVNSYLKERKNQVGTAQDETVKFFSANASPGQKLLIPDPAFPVAFHNGMTILDGRFDHALSAAGIADWIMEWAPFSPGPGQRRLSPETLGLTWRYKVHELEFPRMDRWIIVPDPRLHGYSTGDLPKAKVRIYEKLEEPPLQASRPGR